MDRVSVVYLFLPANRTQQLKYPTCTATAYVRSATFMAGCEPDESQHYNTVHTQARHTPGFYFQARICGSLRTCLSLSHPAHVSNHLRVPCLDLGSYALRQSHPSALQPYDDVPPGWDESTCTCTRLLSALPFSDPPCPASSFLALLRHVSCPRSLPHPPFLALLSPFFEIPNSAPWTQPQLASPPPPHAPAAYSSAQVLHTQGPDLTCES